VTLGSEADDICMQMPHISRLPTRAALFIGGAAILGFGIAGIIRSGLGVAPYDSVNTGLAGHLAIPVGTASWLTAATAVAIAWLLGRKPNVGTLISALLSGTALNTALLLVPQAFGLPGQLVSAVAGFIGLVTGISMIVVADLGAGAPEELMLAMVTRGMPLHVARWGIEAGLLLAGFVLGGSIGIYTFVIVAATGPALAVLIPALSRATKLATR
jgi:uncharacterized membrane protein YczE